MRIFEIQKGGSVAQGITTAPSGALVLGEAGRGRKRVEVLFEQIVLKEGRVVACTPSQPRDPAEVLVVVRDQSGFRGGWKLRVVPSPESEAELKAARAVAAEAHAAWVAAVEATPRSPEAAALRAAEEEEDRLWRLAAVAGDGSPESNALQAFRAGPLKGAEDALGVVCEAERSAAAAKSAAERAVDQLVAARNAAPLPAELTIVAEGRCAQGDAGAMGGGPEYALRCLPGTRFELVRDGRLYGSPARLRVEVGDGSVRVVDVNAEQSAVTL